MDESDFGTMPLKTLFKKCSIPSIISGLFVATLMIADGLFVGNYLGSDALAAVSLVMPLMLISFAVGELIAIGSTVKIAISLGKDDKKSNSIFSASVLMIVVISIFIAAMGILGIDSFFNITGADPELAALAHQYVMPFLYTMPILILFFALDNYLRVCGKVIFSMVVVVGVALINIFLDWYFLGVMGLGIEYAAYATCIPMILGVIVLLIPILFKKISIRFVKPWISFKEIRGILYNGSSEFLSSITGSVLMLLVNAVLLYLIGTSGVAAFSIVMYINSFIGALILSMADSVRPAISYNYGCKKYERSKGLLKILCLASLGMSIIASIIMLLFPEEIVSLFVGNEDTEAVRMATLGMVFYGVAYLFSWFNTVGSQFFTSLDNPKYSIIVMLSQTLLLPIPLMFIMTYFFGADGVFVLGFIVQLITIVITFILMKKMIKKLELEEAENEKCMKSSG